MKIAVVTDDQITISPHFGRAPYYQVFTIEAGQIVGKETRTKAYHGQAGEQEMHTHQHQHGGMVDPISDCQVMLGRGMGTGAYNALTGAGILPIITDIADIDTAVKAYLAGNLVNHLERLH